MDELTKKLIGKDFGIEGKGKPIFYKSEVSMKEYAYDEYVSVGDGRINDLPLDEYPYTIIYSREK
jgi:hypothetical protein